MKLTTMLFGAMLLIGFSCKKENTSPEIDETPKEPEKESIIEINTSFGPMYMWLYKQTPLHRKNFLALADSGYFNNMTFHRIIQNFVIQGGDPNSKDADTTNDGTGGPGYTIPAEFKTTLKHVYGAVGAARTNNPLKESSGSQFYIVTNKGGTANLNMNYTVFGQVFRGLDTAYTISTQPKNELDRPLNNITMQVKVLKFTVAELKEKFNFDVAKADSL
jgi:cyclophilin family peptidyl-prolyl cis-trans isomerase